MKILLRYVPMVVLICAMAISLRCAFTADYANAFDASSTSLFVRQMILPSGGGNAANPFSTSTSFKSAGASGETAVGTSSSATFGLLGGFMRNLYIGPAPTYTQIHYHWRNDDGTETTATSKTSGSQDTSTSVTKLTGYRLRTEISNKGGTKLGYSTQQFRIEYGLLVTTCSAIASWTDVGAAAGDWDMYNSSNITDGNNTTNIAVASGGVADENHTFISSNAGLKDTSSTAAAISVSSDSFIELEYSMQPLAAATDGGTYCFRVTNAGATTNFSYSAYPQATVTAASSLTFSVDGSSEAFSVVSPGVLAATSSLLTVKTTNSTGFNVTLARGDSTGTMSLGTTYIPDKTAWSAPVATTSTGNSTGSTTQPQTLQFRLKQATTDTPDYSSVWWGSADTTAAALFAGIPPTAQTIVNRSTAAAATTTMSVLYNLTVPITQATGAYSGSITYTVTANP